MYQKNVLKINMLIYHLQVKERKSSMFLSKISIYSFVIIHYIEKEDIFVVMQ